MRANPSLIVAMLMSGLPHLRFASPLPSLATREETHDTSPRLVAATSQQTCARAGSLPPLVRYSSPTTFRQALGHGRLPQQITRARPYDTRLCHDAHRPIPCFP